MEYKHYKMFKSVKKWVVASVAAFAMLGLGQVTTQQGTHFGQREVAAADGTTLADAQSAAKTALESAAGTAKDPGNVSWTADKNNGVRMAFGGLGQDLTSEDMHLNTSANVTVSTDDQSAIQQVLSDYENKVASATSVDEVTSLQQEGTAKLALMGVKIQAKAMLAQDYQNVSSGMVYLLNKEAEADAKQTPIRFETSVASQDNYQNTIQNAYQDALTYIDNYSGTAQGLSDEMTSTNISTGLANKIRTLYYPIIQAEYRNDNRYYAYSNMVSTYTLMGNSTVPSDQYSTVLDALEKVNGEVDATPVSAGIHNTNYWMSMGKAMATAGIQALTKQTEAVSSEDKTAIESIANKGLADVAAVNDPSIGWVRPAQIFAQVKSDVLSLISNKTITRTIKYVDAADPNKEVADSRTDTVQLSQGFTVNNYTVTSNGWTSGTFEAVPSPDLSAKGYKAADQATVDASTVTNGDSDQTIVVKYAHDTAVRTADDPGSLPVSDLQKTVTRTIRYVDATGKQLAEPMVQTVTLKREATEDLVTKQVLSYGDWTVASGDWSAVPVPETLASGDYTTPKVNGEAVSTVTADSVTADSSDQTVTVVYQEKDAAEKNNAGQKNDQNQSGSGDRNVNGGQSSTGTNASAQDKQSRTNDSVSATATSAVKKVEAVSSGLPETAKQVVTNPFGIAGLAALSAASYAFFTKKRRDEK